MIIKLILVLASLYSISLQTYVYAYPTSITPFVPAKWADLYFSICIMNSGDSKYEKLFVEAVETWKSVWPHFNYIVDEGRDGCDIDLTLVKYPVGLAKERGSYGTTTVAYLEERGSITSVDVIIPTQTKKEVYQGTYCCKEIIENMSENVFYLTALHEFGHVLGLGHTKDDGIGNLDIMHPSLYQQTDYIISVVTIKGLDDLYGTSTETIDHVIKIQTSVALEARTDREKYVSGETVYVDGRVSKLGGTGSIMLVKLGPETSTNLLISSSKNILELCRPELCYSFGPNDDGSFSTSINVHKIGRWALLVQYLDLSKVLVFDVYDSTIPQHIRDSFINLQLNAWQRAELEGALSNMDDLTITQERILEMVLSDMKRIGK